MKSSRFVSPFVAFLFIALLLVLVVNQSGLEAQTTTSAAVSATSNSVYMPVVPYDSGGYLSSTLAVADLNGDGKQDVVVANPSSAGPDGTIGVLLGNGDGTFKPVVSYDPGPGCNPSSIAVADLNGDGKMDLITANTGCVAVLLGNGDGTFRPAVAYGTGGGNAGDGPGIFEPIAIADLNHDGKLDVAVLNQTNSTYGDGSVAILIGNGDGTLQPVKTYDSGGFGASSFAIADVNRDGNFDLVVANCALTGTTACGTGHGTVAVLLGNGDGSFQAAKLYDRAEAGGFASPVAVADLNADGKLDIVVGNSCTANKNRLCAVGAYATVGVLLGNGDGTFRPAVQYNSGGSGVGWMSVVDVDGDGKPDVVVASDGINVLRGKGDGTFWSADRYFTGGGVGVFGVADVNDDGKLDLIAASTTSTTVAVLLGNGSGFSGPLTNGSGGAAILSDIAVADLNDDGKLDVLAVNWCANAATCTAGANEEGSLGVLLYNPDFLNSGTTTTLASNINPAPTNQLITYTATVTGRSGTAPTGSVSFSQNGKPIGQSPLSDGQASVSMNYSKTATYPIEATYSGDEDNSASTSLTLEEYIKVLPLTTKTILTSSGSPSVGQPVTFTATITPQFGTIPNGEQVTFSFGKTVLGTGTSINGAATLTTTFAKAGAYSIKAAYTGDSSFRPSAGTVKQVITNGAIANHLPAPVAAGALAATGGTTPAKANPQAYVSPCPSKTKAFIEGGGPYVTETVTLGATANMDMYCHDVFHYICTGKMYFYLWSDRRWNELGAGTPVQLCAWEFPTSTLLAGAHRIKAVYTDDGNGFGPSSALTSVEVDKWPTTISLASTPNPSTDNEYVTFTATVTPNAYAPTTPSGKVRFSNGTTTLGAPVVNSNGIATFTTRYLSVGTDSITAEYLGDSDNAPSVSVPLDQVVNAASMSSSPLSTPWR